MKRSCATCLWWPTNSEYEVCRNPDAYGSDPNDPEYWCAKWEPRDRSLVRCETCEWWQRAISSCRHHLAPSGKWLHTYAIERCSDWRLREGRDDG